MDDREFAEAFAAAEGSQAPEPVEAIEPEPEAPAAEPVAEAEPPHVEEEEPATPEYTASVNALLAKYDGDVGKALEAAVHAQETLGRQGNELGELRRIVEEIRDRPEPEPEPHHAQAFVPPNIQEAIEQNPAAVARWAAENNEPIIAEAAMREWYDQDPFAAMQAREQALIETVANVVQKTVEPRFEQFDQREQQRGVVEAHRALTARYPDFEQVLGSATDSEVAGIDRNLLAAAQQQNPAAALEMLYRWVKGGREQQAAAEHAQRTEEVRQEKRAADVVTGDSRVPTAEPTVMDRLKASMLEPEPQSVAHGLTR